jgi:hypothetical protein
LVLLTDSETVHGGERAFLERSRPYWTAVAVPSQLSHGTLNLLRILETAISDNSIAQIHHKHSVHPAFVRRAVRTSYCPRLEIQRPKAFMNGAIFSAVSFHSMFSKTTAWGQNDAQSMHSDPVNSSSLQKTTGGRKSLLERLKPDTPRQAQQKPDAAPKEPQYLDVTAAFFGRQRHQAPRIKNPAPSHHAHQLQHQKPQELPDEPRTPDAPLASELRSELDRMLWP